MDPSDESRLGTFQKHIEDMRNLSLCKICIKPFYEPFILACGHTYCYSCLASWFGGGHGRKRNKNCPDCRAAVTVQPSPNYLLRDLSHMFVGRAELLPEDETLEEHQTGKREEADLLAADRAGPGLFKGAFAVKSRVLRLGGGILDAEDNVVRCPECHWELEEGHCGQCGFREFEADQSESDSDLDSEVSSLHSGATDYGEDGNPIDHEFIRTMNAGFYYDSDTDRSDDYDHDEDDMHDFINDHGSGGEEDPGNESDDPITRIHYLRHNAAVRRQRALDFSMPLPYASRNQGERSAARFSSPERYDEQSDVNTNYDEDSASEEEDDIPAPPPKRRRLQRIVISDDEDEGEDDGAENESLTRSEQSSSAEEDEVTDSSSRAGNTSASQSGDESASSNSGNEEHDTEGDNSESEESDDTAIRPAQSAARRRAFQQSQRQGRVVGRWGRTNGHYNHRPLPRGTRVN
ncbi:hypothetical protein B0A52_02883 [Exophiala mesophila]|uniref:RING-type domain-containing protein n=1 Tax=Exophiala mesophila TaxID=212818 RepID=A0A438NDX4_EXOME|nr:hypothetical protein B0A52_02883 [Exophiala mesophila]